MEAIYQQNEFYENTIRKQEQKVHELLQKKDQVETDLTNSNNELFFLNLNFIDKYTTNAEKIFGLDEEDVENYLEVFDPEKKRQLIELYDGYVAQFNETLPLYLSTMEANNDILEYYTNLLDELYEEEQKLYTLKSEYLRKL